MELPAFVPIERTCPAWLTARALIGGQIPVTLRMVQGEEPSQACVDWDWLHQIVDFAPPEDYVAVAERARQAVDLICTVINVSAFEQFLHTLATAFSLLRMTAELQEQDARRIARGEPSFCMLLRHVLGIENAGPVIFVWTVSA